MRTPPIARTWVKNGSPPLEDLAAVLDENVLELMRIMQGHAVPSERTKQNLAEIFNEPVDKLFPKQGN